MNTVDHKREKSAKNREKKCIDIFKCIPYNLIIQAEQLPM